MAAAGLARGLAPEVGDSSREARELNPAFGPGRLGRMVLLVERLASRLSAANVIPLVLPVILILSNHETVAAARIPKEHSLS